MNTGGGAGLPFALVLCSEIARDTAGLLPGRVAGDAARIPIALAPMLLGADAGIESGAASGVKPRSSIAADDHRAPGLRAKQAWRSSVAQAGRLGGGVY
jgi:hypothetical protein